MARDNGPRAPLAPQGQGQAGALQVSPRRIEEGEPGPTEAALEVGADPRQQVEHALEAPLLSQLEALEVTRSGAVSERGVAVDQARQRARLELLGDDVREAALLVVHPAADNDERRGAHEFALPFLQRRVDDDVGQAEFVFEEHEHHAAGR